MSWTEEKIEKLKELWGKGNTASQIAEIIGGVSRNAVIGKAHRMSLSAKIKNRKLNYNPKNNNEQVFEENKFKRSRKQKFKSLLLDKNFEPAKNLNLEELTEDTCKYMEGHPNEKGSSFCGRKTIDKFGKNTSISVRGRQDPCVGIRAVPIGEAMMHCVLLDHYLMNRAQCG